MEPNSGAPIVDLNIPAIATAAVLFFKDTIKAIADPTAIKIGEHFAKLYQIKIGRSFEKYLEKLELNQRLSDGSIPNRRVIAQSLLGYVGTDGELFAEYFSGIMAASHSNDGEDDGTIPFVQTIKSLSSKQLWLHYCISFCVNKLMLETRRVMSWDTENDPCRRIMFVLEPLNCDWRDFVVLSSQKLLSSLSRYSIEYQGSEIPCVNVVLSLYGIELFAVAHGLPVDSKNFGKQPFEPFPDAPIPELCHTDHDQLCSLYAASREQCNSQ